jgi:hypothetical protein
VASGKIGDLIEARGTAFGKAPAEGGSGAPEAAASTGDKGLSSFVSAEVAKPERPELTSAKIIVSGGRAVKDGKTFEATIFPLADKEKMRRSSRWSTPAWSAICSRSCLSLQKSCKPSDQMVRRYYGHPAPRVSPGGPY